MLRRIFIILVVVIIALVVWLWVSMAKVLDSERSVAAKFNAVVTYYVDMGQRYVAPLLQNPSLSEAERKSLEEVEQDLAALGSAKEINQKYSLLLSAQKKTINFFTGGNIDELTTADPKYVEWNTNATGRGQASLLVLEYNQALLRYNNSSQTLAGKLLQYWPRWQFHDYLGIDGKTQTTIEVRV